MIERLSKYIWSLVGEKTNNGAEAIFEEMLARYCIINDRL